MVEKTQHETTDGKTRSRRKVRWAILGGGTLAILLGAALLLQWSGSDERPSSHELQAGSKPAAVGTARVAETVSQRRPVARVSTGSLTAMIYEDDLARECVQRIGREVLDNMINRMIIQLACQEQGVVVTEEEVDQEILRISKEFNLDPQAWMEFLQAERNITPQQYRRDIIWPMLALKKLAGEQVTITEADMQRAFQRHYGPRVKARMIMFDNIRRANAVWQEAMQHPEEFERLAREHSVDPTSRALDGKIPPIARFSGNEELEKAAFKLREGEISGIIHVGMNRYVILKCEGYTEQVVKDIEEVRPILYQELEKEKVQEMIARYFEKLRQQTRVDNYLTNTSTGGVRRATGRDGSTVRQASGTARPKAATRR
ncbi:MAG: peptidylprolyl isomerase [Planctomycetes bacterium]|nr:peptidylprolyl isomerase [Planctomycetota bacterium]